MEPPLGASVDEAAVRWTKSVQQSLDTIVGDRFAAVAVGDFRCFKWGLVRAGASTADSPLPPPGYRAASRTIAVGALGRCERTRPSADVGAGVVWEIWRLLGRTATRQGD